MKSNYTTGREFADLGQHDNALIYYRLAIKEGDVRGYFGEAMSKDWWLNRELSNESIKNLKMIYPSIEKSADLGDAESIYILSEYFFKGFIFDRDYNKSFDILRKGAEQKDLKCIHGLAKKYLYGNGVAQDPRKAIELLKESANLGYAPSFTELGYECNVIPNYRDNPKYRNAISYYNKAIDLGDVTAMYLLAVLFIHHEEFENVPRAIELLEKARTYRYIPAVLELADLYANRHRDENHCVRAAQLYEEVIESGVTLYARDAMYLCQ